MNRSSALVFLGLFSLWFPAETHASTPFLLALGFFFLLPGIWRNSDAERMKNALRTALPVLALILVQLLRSPDRAQGMEELFLLGALIAFFWAALTSAPDRRNLDIFILGISLLALWGLYQSVWGLQQLRDAALLLPEGPRATALARIERGRAFASLLLPSHLAVMLATVLPFLLERIVTQGTGRIFAGLVMSVCLAGLGATRSPSGFLLGFVAVALFFCLKWAEPGGGSTRVFKRAAVVLSCVAAVVLLSLVFRPDLVEMIPLRLRLDNWLAAGWIFLSAPFSGAGFGSFGITVREIPLHLGNHPVHAHCLPLEMMSDFGLFGLFLTVIGFSGLLKLFQKTRKGGHEALAVSLVIVPLHNLVDFSLFTSAVAIPWVLLLGWAVALTARKGRTPPPLRFRSAVFVSAGVALMLSAAHFFSVVGEQAVPDDGTARLEVLERAAHLAPWRLQPVEKFAAEAIALGGTENLEKAENMLESFSFQQPASAARAQLMAHIRILQGRPIAASLLLRHASKMFFRDNRRIEEYREMLRMLGGGSDERR